MVEEGDKSREEERQRRERRDTEREKERERGAKATQPGHGAQNWHLFRVCRPRF